MRGAVIEFRCLRGAKSTAGTATEQEGRDDLWAVPQVLFSLGNPWVDGRNDSGLAVEDRPAGTGCETGLP
ncbi:hypothetical protein Pan44_33760 [Caulifigura coniformis]|uniref:Uncharacterized protein n=1 Tax=Caulifigura coniformis TaxID=2527983 RepID=A0A517SGT1_9PLAN|nr:hypothetical protein Pan44_33760 [Caulifigura coniformis]